MSISSDTSECAICLEDKEGFIAHLNSGFSYHYSCVQSWIKKRIIYEKVVVYAMMILKYYI